MELKLQEERDSIDKRFKKGLNSEKNHLMLFYIKIYFFY